MIKKASDQLWNLDLEIDRVYSLRYRFQIFDPFT